MHRSPAIQTGRLRYVTLNLKKWMRTAAILSTAVLVAACDVSRTSQQICDCGYMAPEIEGLYSRIPEAPSHIDEEHLRNDLARVWTDHDSGNTYADMNFHWYTNTASEFFACIVLDGSDYVNAYIKFSADTSRTEPLDFRTFGAPFGRERLPWEKC